MRRLFAVGLILTALGAIPARASGPSMHVLVARYSFDHTGSGVLIVNGDFKIVPGALLTLVSVDASDPQHPQAILPQIVEPATAPGVRTYGALGARSLCSAPMNCTAAGGVFTFSMTYGITGDGTHPVHVRFYLAVRSTSIHLHNVSVGWRATKRNGGLVTRTDADASGAGAGASDAGIDAGVMTEVSGPGPRGGSIALAVPGCDIAGAGALSLGGGLNTPSALCPATDPLADVATGRTTWTASGAVVGASSQQTRLAIVSTW